MINVGISDIEVLIKLYRDFINSLKKPKFKITDIETREHLAIEIGPIENSFGTYEAFIKSVDDFLDEEDMHILSMLCKDDKHVKFCLIGKIGYFHFIKKYFQWVCKYFKKRKDLDLIRRIVITFKKSYKYIYRYNYNTCIDINCYFLHPYENNERIKKLFDNKEIDRLNLYRYKILGTMDEYIKFIKDNNKYI